MPSLIRFLCGAAEDFSCGSAPSATVAPRQAAAEKKDLRFNINAFSSGCRSSAGTIINGGKASSNPEWRPMRCGQPRATPARLLGIFHLV